MNSFDSQNDQFTFHSSPHSGDDRRNAFDRPNDGAKGFIREYRASNVPWQRQIAVLIDEGVLPLEAFEHVNPLKKVRRSLIISGIVFWICIAICLLEHLEVTRFSARIAHAPIWGAYISLLFLLSGMYQHLHVWRRLRHLSRRKNDKIKDG